MSGLALVGLILSLFAISFGWSRLNIFTLWLFILLLVIHIAAAFLSYQFSLTSVSDAFGYYYLSNLWKSNGESGTAFVVMVVDVLKSFGATYLDAFIIFQSIGFAGMMLLARTFTEIAWRLKVQPTNAPLALIFLPSVSYWTSAIGKDAPLFFAISLSVWAIIDFGKRFAAFAFALSIMAVFRPHIALIAAASLAACAIFGASMSIGRKIILFGGSMVSIYFAMGAVKTQFGVDVSSITDVSDFLASQNIVYARVSGTTSIGSASWPYRILSLLFRPMFFDAKGPMGIIASIENLGVVLLAFYFAYRRRELFHLFRHVFVIRYAVIFAGAVLLSLSLVYYNVGLGLRQRVMAYPMIFVVVVALWTLGRRQVSNPAPLQGRPGFHPAPGVQAQPLTVGLNGRGNRLPGRLS